MWAFKKLDISQSLDWMPLIYIKAKERFNWFKKYKNKD